MGHPCHLAGGRKFLERRNLQSLSHALAHRARFQAVEKLDWTALAAGKGSSTREVMDPLSSSYDFTGRTAHRRVRRLPLLSQGRALLWRAFRQIVQILLAAITPQP